MNYPEANEVKQGHVNQSIEELAKMLQSVGEEIEYLEQRLSGVLRPDAPQENEKQAVREERVPLANEIRNQADLASRFAIRLANIRKRLEL